MSFTAESYVMLHVKEKEIILDVSDNTDFEDAPVINDLITIVLP